MNFTFTLIEHSMLTCFSAIRRMHYYKVLVVLVFICRMYMYIAS